MKCERVQEDLGAVVDGGLSARAQGRMAAHLATCQTCREELQLLQSLDAALAGEQTMDPPRGMAKAVARRAAARAMVRRRVMIPAWLEALSFVGVGGAAAAVGAIGLRLVMEVGQVEVSVVSAVGVVGVVAAAGLAAFGATYYRA